MSDLDRDNLKRETRKEERAALNPSNQNLSGNMERSGEIENNGSKSKKKIIYGVIGAVLIIGIVLAIALPLALKKKDDNPDGPQPNPPQPLPYDYQEYNPYEADDSMTTSTVFKAQYLIKDTSYNNDQSTSFMAQITEYATAFYSKLTSSGYDYTPVDPKKIPIKQVNNVGTDTIQMNVDMVNNYNFRIFVQDYNNTDNNHQVPDSVFSRPVFEHEARLSQVAFTTETKNFSVSFGNIYSKNTVLSTKNRKLFVSDKFSEMGFILPSRRCYGLGQRNGQFLLQPGAYDLHSRGRDGSLPQDDQLGGKGGNHIHPFIICQTQDKDFMGMFFVGVAPQHFEILIFDNDDRQVLNYITIGGPIEVYVMMRSSAQEIIQRYHAMIGYSYMPPYYSLGVFQGSDSYSTLSQVNNVYGAYDTNQFTLEGVIVTNYNQLPHETFTINSPNFDNLLTSVKAIHAKNQKLVFGASFAIPKNYPIFDTAVQNLCLVDSAVYENGQAIGVLDQTNVFYIDPFHGNTQQFFEQTIPNFYAQTAFDGLYIQDNHLPNQIDGEIVQDLPPRSQPLPKRRLSSAANEEEYGSVITWLINRDQSQFSTYNLPFLPNSVSLDQLSMSMNGTEGGVSTDKVLNLFVHNSNSHRGLQRVKAAILNQPTTNQTRPFILSESSWSGSGSQSVGVITNLNRSWTDFRNVIGQGLSLSMSGIGALMTDTCGSVGPMDEELCARWAQTAAFFPLVRNFYNSTYKNWQGQWVATPPSEPYNIQNFNWQYTYSSAINQRLGFTRYIYSQLYSAYRNGGAVLRPLFFDAPSDDAAFDHYQDTYMLGDSIKVSPILNQGVNDGDVYQSYFTAGVWYDLNDPTQKITLQTGQNVNLKASNSYTNVHLKGGKIIPYQRNDQGKKVTKDFETAIKMSFIVGRDESKSYADGNVFIDDGISAESITFNPNNEQYTFWKLRYAEKSINFWVDFGNFNYVPPEGYMIHLLREVTILDAADLQDTYAACYMGTDLVPREMTIDFNNYTNTLTIKPLGDADLSFKDISIIRFVGAGDANVCNSTTYSYNVVTKDQSDAHKWVYNLANKGSSDIIKPLAVTFTQLDDIGTINVQITTQDGKTSSGKTIYNVPTPEVYDLSKFDTSNLQVPLSTYLSVVDDPFQYSISKDSTKPETLLWTSNPLQLFLSDYFVMDSGIFTMNPNIDQPLIGMGERAGSLFYKNEVNGIHSRNTFDQANPIDDGLPPGRNMYGYQPFYAFQSNIADTFDWVGVFDVNSYATDYIINSDIGNKKTQISKVNIGGNINKFFFVGIKPDDIIKTYSKLVGYQTLPPVWAFGWHQCRFGYVTDQDWLDVYNNYTTQGFPLDAMWADIDYMDDYKLFTISNMSYPNITTYIKQVHDDDRYFVPIMDAGVAVRKNQGYKALDDGLTNDVFIKQANKQDYLTAGVWCGNAYFPDFFKPSTVQWWSDSFDDLNTNQKFELDGIWLDENEATNFCNGYCDTSERPADSLRNKPFYVPGWRDLEDKALGVDGWHDSIGQYEYDVHNLYSLMQTKATAEYLVNVKKLRPYILTRANFPGIGKYSHHWMGDNWSTVDYMQLSVDGVYSYNLFALPFMGSDICGFNGDATNELCTKWHILGSLYPFARNHNQNASKSQEPYTFTDLVPNQDYSYAEVIKRALINRYNFVKYYYTSFYDISVAGGSFFKPLFYEYPLDSLSYEEIQINMLIGSAMKLSMETTNLDFIDNPAVTKDFYFPQARWCRILPPLETAADCFDSAGGEAGYQTYATGLEDYYIHLRGGYIVPYQDATKNGVLKTKDLEKYPTDLYVLTDATGSAKGSLFFDDGVSVTSPTNSAKFDFQLVTNGDKTLTMTFTQTGSGGPFGKIHEEIGVISIYWASQSGLTGLKNAVITLKDKTQQTVPITPPVGTTDIATITLNAAQFTFFDITSITLQP